MPIIRWNPMNDPFAEFDKLFGEGMAGITPQSFIPAVDIYQTAKILKVEVPLAGIDPEDIKIAIVDDVLTITGATEKKTEVDEKNYFRHEVRTGSFHRSLHLPARVDADKAEAVYEAGILTISVPKINAKPPKTIKIKNIKFKKSIK